MNLSVGIAIREFPLATGAADDLLHADGMAFDEEIPIFIGSGLGSTVAGIVLLVVSLVRCRRNPVEKAR